MVFLNYATMQMTAKIVYYGPGLCGKTTNLQWIHQKTAPSSRGDMVSLETEADRTLFFDLLPLEVGIISGMRVRLQLYTVPGQVFYNTTRRMVLKGADGLVFVADSQTAAFDATVESFRNLKTNMSELGMSFADIPLVFQYNKRDLRSIVPVDQLQRSLNPGGGAPFFEASAVHGVGVFETLKAISRLALAALRQKVAIDTRPSPPRSAPVAPPILPRKDVRPAQHNEKADTPHPSAIEQLLGGDVPMVDVEFAEEDASRKTVRPVHIQDSDDILHQLENLRQNTDPAKPSGGASDKEARPGPKSTRPGTPPRPPEITPGSKQAAPPSQAAKVRPAEVGGTAPATAGKRPAERKEAAAAGPTQRPGQPQAAPAARSLARRAAIEVPLTVLEGVTEVRLHLALVRDGKEQLVKDVTRVTVPGVGSHAPIALHVDLEVRPKR
jgi:signal recognition particle receptor subunit beta